MTKLTLVLRAFMNAGAVLALFACATASKNDSTARLQTSVEAYNEAFRWKNYERASGFLPPELRAAFVAAYEDDEKSLHVEDYQVLSVDRPGSSEARIQVRLTYVLLPSTTVEKKTVVQHWHEVGGSWILESEDNPIRDVKASATSANLGNFGGEAPEATSTDVELPDPSGGAVRREGSSPEPEEPPSDEPGETP